MSKNKFAFKTEPMAHQLKALELSVKKPVFALLMEQGTGKSKVIIDTAMKLFLNCDINGVLIVAPSGVDYSWIEKEIPKHLRDELCSIHYLYRTASAKKQAEIIKLNKFLNARKDSLKILVTMPEALMTKSGEETALKFLTTCKTLMVVDESGKLLKNHKAQRTKRLIKLGKLAKYRRILTGTPVTKSPLDLFAQFFFLDPKILGYNNYFSFKNYFAIEERTFAGARSFMKIIGYQNQAKLLELIKPYSFRVLKSECLDLPPKIYQTQYYSLSSHQSKFYEDLKKDDVAFPGAPSDDFTLLEAVLNNGDAVVTENALKKLLRLQQIIGGYVPLESGKIHSLFPLMKENPRITALLEALENVTGKVIIWCRFVNEIKSLGELLGGEAVTYYGELKSQQREEAMRLFQTTDGIRFLIANQSMGYGWTANEATTVIYYSNDFNLEHRLQSEDRCHRTGQNKSVTYIDIVAENTVDEHILRILTQKMQYSKMLDNLNN